MAAFKDEDEYSLLNSTGFQNPPMLSNPHEFPSVGITKLIHTVHPESQN